MIIPEVKHLDEKRSLGLEGEGHSIAYRVHEIERHVHSFERWFGAAVVPNGEIHVADRIGTTTTAFQADAGDNTWGSWLQILGSSDTPADAGMISFDGHRALIVNTERLSTIYLMQIAGGSSGATGLAGGIYTEFPILPETLAGRIVPISFQTDRIAASTKLWIRIWAIGQNTGTMDFFFGIHEYEG